MKKNSVLTKKSICGLRINFVADIDGAIAYKNPALVKRFAQEQGVGLQYAKQLFEELKKYLLMCGLLKRHISPPVSIDSMWHKFIYHDTRVYEDFCLKYIGRYIHHKATSKRTVASVSLSASKLLLVVQEIFGPPDKFIWGFEGGLAECLEPTVGRCDDD